ncbi:MAG: SAM-dependent methyltransferase [Nitrospirota bacterium]
MNRTLISLAEKGVIPDALIRRGIRLLNRRRLKNEEAHHSAGEKEKSSFIHQLRLSPVATHPDKPNEQHYEIPPEFFMHILGKRMKYSCSLWSDGVQSVDRAEELMLDLTCRRAGIQDGMNVLELGCGWGSLSLWIAENFPQCRIVAVSNSRSQREYIERVCMQSKIETIQVLTADMNDFHTERRFDRIISIEMFEHMRNYDLLLSRIAQWLDVEGKLFVHIFCHREFSYIFETKDEDDWMSKYFFTAGLMPSDDLLQYFQDDLRILEHWRVPGFHYQKTAEAWLHNLDAKKEFVLPILSSVYGQGNELLWYRRWRIFFMACSELFGYRNGLEWWVAHYLFSKK